MSECPYLTLIPAPRRVGRPKRRIRRRAMCLISGPEMQRCQQCVRMRGERCHVYREKHQSEEEFK